jgi:hypothetical protein
MYRILIGIAAIIAATGYLLRSLPDAQAQSLGPVVSLGEAPWVSITGEVEQETTETIYTVPSDQVFVLTGACLDYSGSDIYEDSTLKIDAGSYASYCSSTHLGMLGQNTSHIVFAAGSEVIIDAGNNTVEYLMQGYLAHP